MLRKFSRALRTIQPSIQACRFIKISAALKNVEIKMPSLSPTMTSGTIVKWLKSEGEAVAPGDSICEIQTDKAVVSMEVDEEGVLAKILIPENTPDIEIGTLIALLAEPGEDWTSVKVPETSGVAVPKSSELSDVGGVSLKQEGVVQQTASVGHISKSLGPAVKMLMDVYGLNKSDILATGPHGAVLKGDVLRHVSLHNLKPGIAGDIGKPKKEIEEKLEASFPTAELSTKDFTDIPLTNMRKTIAKRLTQSKTTIPHAYATTDVSMSAVLRMRKEMKSIADGINVSVNDFIIKASAFALRSVPAVNVQLDGDSVRCQKQCDVSVAVATNAGLITPIIHSADVMGLEEISGRVKELAEKAKQNKLQPEEFIGGTFTVSNLGMFGISEFTAIINPPQAAILAIGGSFDALTTDLKPEPRMTVTLCFDNRAISEDVAAEFLRAFSEGLADPEKMLLGSTPNFDADLQMSLALL